MLSSSRFARDSWRFRTLRRRISTRHFHLRSSSSPTPSFSLSHFRRRRPRGRRPNSRRLALETARLSTPPAHRRRAVLKNPPKRPRRIFAFFVSLSLSRSLSSRMLKCCSQSPTKKSFVCSLRCCYFSSSRALFQTNTRAKVTIFTPLKMRCLCPLFPLFSLRDATRRQCE